MRRIDALDVAMFVWVLGREGRWCRCLWMLLLFACVSVVAAGAAGSWAGGLVLAAGCLFFLGWSRVLAVGEGRSWRSLFKGSRLAQRARLWRLSTPRHSQPLSITDSCSHFMLSHLQVHPQSQITDSCSRIGTH